MSKKIFITGANGFLGSSVLELAKKHYHDAEVLGIFSPRDSGPDLTSESCLGFLKKFKFNSQDEKILIHIAASVKWNTIEGVNENSSMAYYIGKWALENNFARSILVSGTNVYPLILSKADIHTPTNPGNLYGLGKICAEKVWEILLPEKHRTVVRLCGIWGWQKKPTLFWNTILKNALDAESKNNPPLILKRNNSFRNYISTIEASRCLFKVIDSKLDGIYLASGLEKISLYDFAQRVKKKNSSHLNIAFEDDGKTDEQYFEPSAEFKDCLLPVDQVLSTLWENKPL